MQEGVPRGQQVEHSLGAGHQQPNQEPRLSDHVTTLTYSDLSHLILSSAFNAQTVANTRNDRSQVWSKTIQLDTPYRFGIIINTSRTAGFVQLYFNGQPATMSDPASGAHTTKLAGNFFPGRADPKFGLYAGTTASATDAYIYDVVIGDGLDDIREVAGL